MPDPEQSKIKIDAPKVRVLFMTDWGDTGFGTVGRELCVRMAEMEVLDIHYLGWHSRPHHTVEAHANKFTLHNTQFWDGGDQFGAKTFDKVIEHVRPKVVVTLADPWMVNYVAKSEHRDTFTWVAYTPIDRDYISRSWRKSMRKPDVLVLYSQFGVDVINEQIPFRHPELILHGVDRMLFKPWYPDGMDEDTPLDELMSKRKEITINPGAKDNWIVGFVGRNQIRKAIPRAFRAFKAFNCATWIERQKVEHIGEDGSKQDEWPAHQFCPHVQKFRCDVCPAFQQREETTHSIIYLHTTRGDGSDPQDKPGIGWLIDELAERYQMQGRIGMTNNLTALKGVSRAMLAQVMNCFDVHLFLSHSEGFGLPIAEALACGVPTLVTDYSSMPELVSKGGGWPVDVVDYDTYVTWENDWANADIGDAADKINKLFSDPELYASMRKAAADNDYTPSWNEVAMQFRNLILAAARS